VKVTTTKTSLPLPRVTSVNKERKPVDRARDLDGFQDGPGYN
jgi:hypothetical protein